MRIDAHVHYLQPLTPEKLARFVEREPYWGLLVSPQPGARSIQGWATAERMLADMDKAGLDRVVIQGTYPQRHESSVVQNNHALELVRRRPNRVMAFAAVQPRAGQQALDELKRCVEEGLCGVGELNPYAQGYSMADPAFLRVVERCIEYDVPLNLHVSEEIGPHYLGKSTTPLEHYYRLAQRYPELKLILAHWGGGLIFYEMMPRVRRVLKNVWYDTAASPLLYPTRKIFKVALSCLDQRKILYGSDYPLLICPREQTEPDFGPFLAQIDSLDLDQAVYEDILGMNAARLLGLVDQKSKSTTKAEEQRARETGTITFDAIYAFMAVRLVADEWPETREVFERYGIPWQESAAPVWEPIAQAAAARGWGPKDRQRLLDELNELVSK